MHVMEYQILWIRILQYVLESKIRVFFEYLDSKLINMKNCKVGKAYTFNKFCSGTHCAPE